MIRNIVIRCGSMELPVSILMCYVMDKEIKCTGKR